MQKKAVLIAQFAFIMNIMAITLLCKGCVWGENGYSQHWKICWALSLVAFDPLHTDNEGKAVRSLEYEKLHWQKYAFEW